jgi:hypothetical protein
VYNLLGGIAFRTLLLVAADLAPVSLETKRSVFR